MAAISSANSTVNIGRRKRKKISEHSPVPTPRASAHAKRRASNDRSSDAQMTKPNRVETARAIAKMPNAVGVTAAISSGREPALFQTRTALSNLEEDRRVYRPRNRQ